MNSSGESYYSSINYDGGVGNSKSLKITEVRTCSAIVKTELRTAMSFCPSRICINQICSITTVAL